MSDVESQQSPRKRVEDLMALSLYQARVNKVKEYVGKLYKSYELHLKPLKEVRKALAEGLDEEKTLSQQVVELRRRETH